MKLDPMAKNSQLLNMKPILDINDSSFTHKSSMFHTYIQFHQDFKSLQQGIGEMALFLQYWTTIHDISWNLDLIDLLNLNKNHLHQNKKYWIKRSSLKEMNISPSAPHSIELKYGEKT